MQLPSLIRYHGNKVQLGNYLHLIKSYVNEYASWEGQNLNTNRTDAIIRQCYKFTLMVFTAQLTTLAQILKKFLKYYKIEVKFTGLMIVKMRF